MSEHNQMTYFSANSVMNSSKKKCARRATDNVHDTLFAIPSNVTVNCLKFLFDKKFCSKI